MKPSFRSFCSFLFILATALTAGAIGCRGDWKGVPGQRWDPGAHTPLPSHPFGDQGSGGNPYAQNAGGTEHVGGDVSDVGGNDSNEPTPSEELPHVFVSGLQLSTCDMDPPQIEIPRMTPNTGCRATIHVTPYWEDGDGNMEEVGADISWFSDAPSWATVNTSNWTSDHDTAWGLGTEDLFDRDGVFEPHTFFHACTTNACHPTDVGCAPMVCSEPILVTGVANIEGTWWMATDADPTPFLLTIFQDGRVLTIAPWLEQGSVNGANVSWSAEEQIFQGVLAGREYVSGLRWDEMGLNIIGTWEAWR
jgi:hypothetical protein